MRHKFRLLEGRTVRQPGHSFSAGGGGRVVGVPLPSAPPSPELGPALPPFSLYIETRHELKLWFVLTKASSDRHSGQVQYIPVFEHQAPGSSRHTPAAMPEGYLPAGLSINANACEHMKSRHARPRMQAHRQDLQQARKPSALELSLLKAAACSVAPHLRHTLKPPAACCASRRSLLRAAASADLRWHVWHAVSYICGCACRAPQCRVEAEMPAPPGAVSMKGEHDMIGEEHLSLVHSRQ